MTDQNRRNFNLKKTTVKEIDLKEIFIILKRKIGIIILTTIVITILGVLYNKYTTTYLYQSSTRVLIAATAEEMKTLVVMMEDPVIMEKVIRETGMRTSPEGLASQISVNIIGNSQVVLLTAVDHDPQIAALIANKTAKIFQEEIEKILNFKHVKLLKEAKENPIPINDNDIRFLTISIFIGLGLGIGLVFFLNSLDETVKNDEEIEDLIGLPVIGNISKITKKNLKKDANMQEEVKVRGETVGIQ